MLHCLVIVTYTRSIIIRVGIAVGTRGEKKY